jgi:signal peptide peptidase SppA
MKVLDILCAPWAILPAALGEIQSIYATHLRGEKIDVAAVEKRLGRPLETRPAGYEVVDGVAVLPLVGPSARRMNLMTQISGGVSTELAARDLRAAAADETARAIVLRIDSPGGTVDGTQGLAQLVAEIDRTAKPVVTLASGTMASAAYWYGSASRAVYIEDDTTQVGSIGVVASHVDISAAEAAAGVRTTEIVAGRYKRIASQYGPLTAEGRQTMQDQVDYLYSLFVQAVADNRGVAIEQVLSEMADGRIFIGQQAVRAGLVDGVSTLEALVADLSRSSTAGAGVAPRVRASAPQTMESPTMPITREQLSAEAPELIEALQAEGRQQGAAAECERIQAVFGQAMPGHDALIRQLAFDGKTTGPEAAVAVLAAERNQRTRAAAQLQADAPQPVPQAATPAVDAPAAPAAADDGRPVEQRCEDRWQADPAVRAEFGSLAVFTAFTRAEESGRARIHRPRAA